MGDNKFEKLCETYGADAVYLGKTIQQVARNGLYYEWSEGFIRYLKSGNSVIEAAAGAAYDWDI